MRIGIAAVLTTLAATLAHGADAVDNRSRGKAAVRLSSLVGAEAVDAARAPLGRVEEILVDAAQKRLSHARVRGANGAVTVPLTGGILFEDGRLVALPARARAPAPGRELHRATEILEARVQDFDGRQIAKLHDVVVERDDGRIRHAVVTVDEGIGHPERRIAIRMPAMSYERVGSNDVVLIATRRELDAAPGVDMRGIQ